MKANPTCRKCGVELIDDNWYLSQQKKYDYICKSCSNKRVKQWREANPERAKAIWTRQIREQGHQPFDENKECSQYLGVHVAKRMLSYVFKNVQRMPINNHGYDFICGRGYKIDVKSSCYVYSVVNGVKYPHWYFDVMHNTIADYFLLLAFDNREDLTPLYIWLIPGDKLNHYLTGTSISLSTIHKWDEYRLDITKVVTCCNTMKEESEK